MSGNPDRGAKSRKNKNFKTSAASLFFEEKKQSSTQQEPQEAAQFVKHEAPQQVEQEHAQQAAYDVAQKEKQQVTHQVAREHVQEAAQEAANHRRGSSTQQAEQEVTQQVMQQTLPLPRRTVRTQGRKGKKKPRINMAFEPDVYEFILAEAQRRGMSLTQMVNELIYDQMELHKK